MLLDDPYIPMAALEKAENPKKRILIRSYKREDVAAVDKLIEIADGHRDEVKTESDWAVVEIIFQFFMQRWPVEFQEFYDAIPKIRSSRRDKGYSKNKEIKYVGALPRRFMRLVKVIFPQQEFDKKFVNKIVKRIPLLKVG